MTNSAKNVTSGEITADVAVIGGGGAGLSAAVTASEKGARVVVLESRRTPGGSSVLASGFFCPVLPGQKIEDITAQNDLFFKKALNYSHWKTNPRLIRALIEKSTDSVVWLERQGVRFQIDANYGFDQNRSMSRISGPGRGGSNVIKALVSRCEALGIPIITETRAQQLITDQGGRVIGVQADHDGRS